MIVRGWVIAAAALALLGCNNAPKPRFIDAGRPVYQVSSARDTSGADAALGNGGFVFDGGGVPAKGFRDAVMAGAGDNPHLCIIVTANEGQGELYRTFDGLENVTIHVLNLLARHNGDAQALQVLEQCTAYIFDAGEPARLAEVLFDASGTKDSLALQTIRRGVQQRHALVAGRGAGAMMLGSFALCECSGKSSINALTEGRLTEAPGFQFFSGPLIDTHYFAQGLMGRHLAAMNRHGYQWGIGIDDGAALSVPETGPWQVLGDGEVAIIHLLADTKDDALRFRLHILRDGDYFDPSNGSVSLAPGRTQILPQVVADPQPLLVEDVFGPYRIRDMIAQMIDTQSSRISGITSDGLINVDFALGPETQIYRGAKGYTIFALEGRVLVTR